MQEGGGGINSSGRVQLRSYLGFFVSKGPLFSTVGRAPASGRCSERVAPPTSRYVCLSRGERTTRTRIFDAKIPFFFLLLVLLLHPSWLAIIPTWLGLILLYAQPFFNFSLGRDAKHPVGGFFPHFFSFFFRAGFLVQTSN